jgi:hypothetical protein
MVDMAPHDRVLEWETPASKLGVGHSGNGACGMFTRKFAFFGQVSGITSYLGSAAVVLARESDACNDGGECGQDWDEGEKPHSVVE